MTEQMEIKYAPALQTPQEIIFNFEDLKKEITKSVEKYNGLVVTEDAIQEAKKTKADLNKFKTMIDGERKRVKNVYLEPYEKVKPQFDELFNLIEEPVKAIDSQIKTFEEQEKQAKLDEIEKIYQANIGPLETLVPLKSIFITQWENKGTTLKKIEAEIIEKIKKINSDLEAINTLNSDFVVEVKETYLAGFDLSAALQKGQRLAERQKELEQLKQQSKIKKAVEAQALNVQTVEPEQKPAQVIYSEDAPKFYIKTFSIRATKEQLIKLNDCLIENKIEYTVEG